MNKATHMLTKVIQSENDLLKYEYIEMVRNGREDEHLKYLLSNPAGQADFTQLKLK